MRISSIRKFATLKLISITIQAVLWLLLMLASHASEEKSNLRNRQAVLLKLGYTR